MQTQTMTKPNRYPANCIRCGARIPAHGGLLARDHDGRWAADHDGPCPDKPTAVATPIRRADRDGLYRTPDGTLWKVQIAKNGSGRLYAKRFDTTTRTFEYTPGAIHNLRADQRLTVEQVAQLGADENSPLYGTCAICGRDLTDEDSIAAGIGPICASKY